MRNNKIYKEKHSFHLSVLHQLHMVIGGGETFIPSYAQLVSAFVQASLLPIPNYLIHRGDLHDRDRRGDGHPTDIAILIQTSNLPLHDKTSTRRLMSS